MNKAGPIVVIEDDADDQDILREVFLELDFPNEIVFFGDGYDALHYLKDEKIYPFLILSDINMPKITGFELKSIVHTNEELSEKCIPYLFFTTSASQQAVYTAYAASAQGFFVKPNSFKDIKRVINNIVNYWQDCYSPSTFGHRASVKKHDTL